MLLPDGSKAVKLVFSLLLKDFVVLLVFLKFITNKYIRVTSAIEIFRKRDICITNGKKIL